MSERQRINRFFLLSNFIA